MMTLTTERETITGAAATVEAATSAEAAASDRRRPGRIRQVSPELIPILRASERATTLDQELELEGYDELAGMRGVFSGLTLSIPLWVGIGYVGRWLLF